MEVDSAIKLESIPGDKPASLRRKTTRAAIASGFGETITRVLMIVLSIATARALEPAEVGILGLAVIIIGIFSLIGACSETAGVITRLEESDGQHAFSAFTIRSFITVILTACILFFTPIIAGIVTGGRGGDGHLSALLRIMLWVPVLELVSSYPRVLLQRQLDLSFLVVANLIQVVFHVGLSIVILWMGYGSIGLAWAAVAGVATSTIVVWLRLWRLKHHSQQIIPSLKLWHHLLRNSGKIFISGFTGYLNGRLDNLLVAGVLGPTAMSFYSMAWNTSRIPGTVLSRAMCIVFTPTISHIQNDTRRVRQAVNESLQHSYLLLAPISAVLFVSAPVLVTVVLGEKWSPIVPCLRIMCFTILLEPIIYMCGSLLYANERVELTALATLSHIITLLLVIQPLARRWDIVGASFGDMAAMFVQATTFYIITRLTLRRIGMSLFPSIIIPFLAAILSTAFAWIVGLQVASGIVRLWVQLVILLVGYTVFIVLLGGKDRLVDLFNLLRIGLKRPVEA